MYFSATPAAHQNAFNQDGFTISTESRSYPMPTDVHAGISELFWRNSHTRFGLPGWVVGEKETVRLRGPAGSGQVEVEPPTVTDTPAVSAAGGDSQWTPGETVEVALTFSEAVEVETNNGVPSIGIGLSVTHARAATYLRGSGTTELVFAYTLVQGDGEHDTMGVTPNSLALNGGAIRSVASGTDAVLDHNGAAVQGSAGRTTPPNPARETSPRCRRAMTGRHSSSSCV